ncbi:MAG TPA: hypothetical protein VGC99_27740 [Candidatus Tectomicrobia bacterium]
MGHFATFRSHRHGAQPRPAGGSHADPHPPLAWRTLDVYAEPSVREARIRIDRINARLWRAQGSEFTPAGVSARDVEPAYPLAKILNKITGEGSAYAQLIHSATRDLYDEMTQGVQ